MKIGSGKKLIIASLAWVCLMGSPLVTQADAHHGNSEVGVSVVEKKGGGRIPPPPDKSLPTPSVVDGKEKVAKYRTELPQTSEKKHDLRSFSLGIIMVTTAVMIMVAKRRRTDVQS